MGRKGCDVIINKDRGVSRVHAEIIVEEMIALNPLQSDSSNISSRVRVKDCSKYGTFVNKNLGPSQKVHELPSKEATLKDGDIVSFGTGNANYRFCYVPLVFFICCFESSQSQVNHPIQDKVASIGAFGSPIFFQECTHVLLDRHMPVKDDLLDAFVAKKPFVLCSWLEYIAGKNICTEIPSFNSYGPALLVDEVSVEIVEPNSRENCFEGYTFLLEQTEMYSFGDRLQTLLEVTGAKCISVESFHASTEASDYRDNSRLVCVIPKGSIDKFNRFNKLSLVSRVKEIELVRAALSGRLDVSILTTPPVAVVVSSSCSTDETIVADSEEECEAITSIHKPGASSVRPTGDVNREIPLSNVIKVEEEAPNIKNDIEEKIALSYDATKLEEHHAASFEGGLTARKHKVDKSEEGNSDIIYSQVLVVRDSALPFTVSRTTDHRVPNFKRFRKTNTQSGNSFNNLVPFAKYPYKDSDLGNEEIAESVKQEKKRKQMEAVAEDLFNNEKGKKRGAGFSGSLHGLLSRG